MDLASQILAPVKCQKAASLINMLSVSFFLSQNIEETLISFKNSFNKNVAQSNCAPLRLFKKNRTVPKNSEGDLLIPLNCKQQKSLWTSVAFLFAIIRVY